MTDYQWKTVLKGLKLFSGSNLDIVQLLNEFSDNAQNFTTSMTKGANHTISMYINAILSVYIKI